MSSQGSIGTCPGTAWQHALSWGPAASRDDLGRPEQALVRVLSAQGKGQQGACEGILAISQAWPSTIRTVQGDHKRFQETYFSTFPVRSDHPCWLTILCVH